MKYIELFAGIGGMGHGLMQAGMECVGYCEIDKFAHKAFQILHDPDERMWNAYDVRSVTDDDIRLLGRKRGNIDLIAGGFPCQAFSIAGKRQGFQDSTRGTLFFEIIRFASILKPQYLLLENVTGLLNHDGGRTFETVIRTLDELGYVGEWCVLNSATYVPQNRERVFIVASLGGTGGRKVFPFGNENGNSIEVVGQLSDDTGGTGKLYGTDGIAPTQLAQHGNAVTKVVVGATSSRLGKTQDIANTLQARDYKGLQGRQEMSVVLEPIATKNTHEVAILRQKRSEYGKQVRKKYEAGELDEGRQSMVELEPRTDGIANTLTTVQKDNLLLTGYRIRKLTPLECFRLQSFPDEWYHTLKQHDISDSQLYKMAGNAVTSRVAYEIGTRIMKSREEVYP